MRVSKIKIFFLSFLAVEFILFSFQSSVYAHTDANDEQIIIHIDEQGFHPQTLSIEQGQAVIFENSGSVLHWPASNIHPTHRAYPNTDITDCFIEPVGLMFDACKGLAHDERFTFIFEHAGEWPFHDHLYSEFTGRIIVNEIRNFESAAKVDQRYDRDVFVTSEKKGLLFRFWDGVKSFFRKFFGKKDTNISVDIVTSSDGDPVLIYDEYIASNNTEIISDDDALYSYLKKYGTVATLQQLLALESIIGDCHQAAHSVGRYTYELYDEQAFQQCTAECHSGCYHGATESFFRDHGTSNLETELELICDIELNEFFTHQCIHGIGHGLMAWADYEIFDALENCDLLPSHHESCYSGVFMENIIVGLAEDQGHTTEYLSDDPHFPCTVIADTYKNACYFYQTSRMTELFDGDFSRVADACNEAPEIYRPACFASMGRDIGGYHRNNPASSIRECLFAPSGNYRTLCFNGAVQDVFWDPSGQKVALEFCQLVTDTESKMACYRTISQRADAILISVEDKQLFCENVEAEYISVCREEISFQ